MIFLGMVVLTSWSSSSSLVCQAFTPLSSSSTIRRTPRKRHDGTNDFRLGAGSDDGKTFFFADVKNDAPPRATDQDTNDADGRIKKAAFLFTDETIQEANDALASVGWAPPSQPVDGEGELTSDDPFVKVRQHALSVQNFKPIRTALLQVFVTWSHA